MRKQKGFSLIELLIVVAIILIIAAIAIPNLLRARIAANESSAVQSIRTINTAEVTYQSTFPNIGFSSTMSALGTGGGPGTPCGTPASTAACLLDPVLASATTTATPKSGYYFTYTPAQAVGGIVIDYTVEGSPVSVGQSGVRGFCSDSDGVIRYINPGPAAVTTTSGCSTYTALQ